MQNPGLFKAETELFHHKGDDKGGRSTHAELAMHKNIVFFKVVLDIAMRFFKMRIYGLILIIQDINPLMFLNFVPFDLVFDLKKVEFFTVND